VFSKKKKKKEIKTCELYTWIISSNPFSDAQLFSPSCLDWSFSRQTEKPLMFLSLLIVFSYIWSHPPK